MLVNWELCVIPAVLKTGFRLGWITPESVCACTVEIVEMHGLLR